MSKENKNAREMRTVLIEGALPALEKLMEVFTDDKGEHQLTSDQADTMNMIWPTLSTMIAKESDYIKIDAKNTSAIIELLAEGKITISDAKDFMNLLSVQSDIEDIKTLLAKVQQLTGDGQTL